MDKLIEMLQSLADKLGVTIQCLWPKMIGYTIVQAAVNLIEDVVAISMIYLLWKFAVPKFIAKFDEDNQEAVTTTTYILVGLVTLLIFLCTIPGLSEVIGALIYPEGALVHQLLGK